MPLSLTTPDNATLVRLLDALARAGVTHVALEASSIGLDQGRLHGLSFGRLAFTDVTDDHVEYHGSWEALCEAKLDLLRRHALSGVAVTFRHGNPLAPRLKALAGAWRGVLRSVSEEVRRAGTDGNAGADLWGEVVAEPDDEPKVWVGGRAHPCRWNVRNPMETQNRLQALALTWEEIAADPTRVLDLEPPPVPGRFEVACASDGVSRPEVMVDYAHTADALERLLATVAPGVAARNGRLHVVFGCGGCRDRGKRRAMFAAAHRYGDRVTVTNDNPRQESPQRIIREVCAEATRGQRNATRCVEDRRDAIADAMEGAKPDDLVVVSGRGAETEQVFADHVRILRDSAVVRRIADAMATDGHGRRTRLWTPQDITKALSGGEERASWLSGTVPKGWRATGLAFGSGEVVSGDMFVALEGTKRDGHDFVAEARERGAVVAVVRGDKWEAVRRLSPDLALVPVADVRDALEAMARFARDRAVALRVAVTGSVGKTTVRSWTAHAAKSYGSRVHEAPASYNNRLGVSLTLARMAPQTQWAILELGTNAPGEIRALSALCRPHVGVITALDFAHAGGFEGAPSLGAENTLRAIAEEKLGIAHSLQDGGALVLPSHPVLRRCWERLSRVYPVSRVIWCGRDETCSVRICGRETLPNSEETLWRFRVEGTDTTVRTAHRGSHQGPTAAWLVGVGLGLGWHPQTVADSLSDAPLPTGRGGVSTITLGATRLHVVDDHYNAAPSAVRAGLETLASLPRIRLAVLGDMAELGRLAENLHGGLVQDLSRTELQRVYVIGTQFRTAAEAAGVDCVVCVNAEEAASALMADLHRHGWPQASVLIKGANHHGLGRVAERLREGSCLHVSSVDCADSSRQETAGNHGS